MQGKDHSKREKARAMPEMNKICNNIHSVCN